MAIAAAVLACLAVGDSSWQTMMLWWTLQTQLQNMAAVTAICWICQQPGIVRLMRAPRRPRRLWSDRFVPYSNKEESNGAWEHTILGKAARLSEAGLQDRADMYYR
jgi:hypothetical protein